MSAVQGNVSRLVGRDEDLVTVRDTLLAAEAGRPAAVLVSGEAGVGKSRLCREVLAAPAFAAWALVEAFALPGVGVPPYYVTGRLSGRLARLPGAMPGAAADVSARLHGNTAPGSGPSGQAGEGRFRLLDAVVQLVESVASSRPLLIAIDDMQWAGPSDWAVLVHVLKTADAPVALLIAARDEGLWRSDSAALPSLLELNRERLMRTVTLAPLAAPQVAALCAGLVGAPAASSLVEDVVRLAGGNPFLTEELVGHLIREGAALGAGRAEPALHAGGATPLPPTVRLSTAQLVDSLGPAAKQAVQLAAIAGREFSEPLLVAAGCDDRVVAAALSDAEAVGLVRPGNTQWTFRHDLIREAVIAAIPADERRALHRRIASALSASQPGAAVTLGDHRWAAAVDHWRQAGDDLGALSAAVHASRHATRVFAPDEAARFARIAYDCATRLQDSGAPPAGAASLLDALELVGDAELDVGSYIEAERHFEALLLQARAAGNTAQEGRALLRLGLAARRRESPGQAVGFFTSALSVLEGIAGEGRSVARALVELANLGALTLAEYGSAEEFANRALGLARSLGDHRLEVEALIALGNNRTRSEGPKAARPLLGDALLRAEAAGELTLATDTAAALSNNYYWSGELRRAIEFGVKRLDLATRSHDIFGLRHGHSWLALLSCSRGDWDQALTLLADAEPMLARLASPEPLGFVRVVQAFVHYRLGDDALAAAEIDEALDRLSPLGDGTLLWYGSLAALICLAAGLRDRVEEHMARQEARLVSVPADALPARSARAALGLAYTETGDLAGASRCAAALEPFEDDYHWSPVRRTLARVAALTGDHAAALRHLGAAERQARAELLRPDLGLILLERSMLSPANGSSPNDALDEAARIFEELGMRRELALVESLSPSQDRKLPGGLSGRQVEVLDLIARGCSNREIAARLVISERTVINHVSAILAKLNVDNRAAAAAFAVRHGLAHDVGRNY